MYSADPVKKLANCTYFSYKKGLNVRFLYTERKRRIRRALHWLLAVVVMDEAELYLAHNLKQI